MANGNCARCQQPLDGAHKTYCKKCAAEYAKARRDADPEVARTYQSSWQKNNVDKMRQYKQKWRLRTEYNLTVGQYKEMLLAQGGRCANQGCQVELIEFDKGASGLAVDHCHETNTVRGLLCNRCNLALGLLDDDPNKITGIAQYVTEYLEAYTRQPKEG
jgi:hypothetical protein